MYHRLCWAKASTPGPDSLAGCLVVRFTVRHVGCSCAKCVVVPLNPAEKPLGASAHLCLSLTQRRSARGPVCQWSSSWVQHQSPLQSFKTTPVPGPSLRTCFHGSGLGRSQTFSALPHSSGVGWGNLISAKVEKKRKISGECNVSAIRASGPNALHSHPLRIVSNC